MNIPCCHSIKCPGVDSSASNLDFDSPIANLTAELPDSDPFIALNWGWDNNQPPLGSNWSRNSCLGLCTSLISQQDADLCAARANLVCLVAGGWGTPPGGEFNGGPSHGPPLILPPPGDTPTVYTNGVRSCGVNCPDGLGFVYTVQAGLFAATSQALADAMADSYACRLAGQFHICLGPLPPVVCKGTFFANLLNPTGGVPPYTFSVAGGALPPGTTLDQSGTNAQIGGIPTATGDYTFSIRVVDRIGDFMTKTYVMSVLGINNASPLPNAVENTPYSTQLLAVGGTAPYTFTITDGTTPNLSLSPSGLLTGTPAYVTAGTYTFTVSVKDSAGHACAQVATIKVTLRPGPDWTKLVWAFPVVNNNPPHEVAQGSASGNTASGFLQKDATIFANFPKIDGASGTGVTYTGGAVTSRIRLTVAHSGAVGNGFLSGVSRNGVPIGNLNLNNAASGVYEADIAIGASVNAVMTVADGSPGTPFAQVTGAGTANQCSFTWAIFNV